MKTFCTHEALCLTTAMDGLLLFSDLRVFPKKSNGDLMIGSQNDFALFTNAEDMNDSYLSAAV